MKTPNEEIILKIKPRPSETVTISIPKDTLGSLQRIAKNKEMSLEALLKFYIGRGLREELAENFPDRSTEPIVENKIYEAIESLPEESRTLLVDYIELLKKRFGGSRKQESEETLYEKFEESGFTGCCSVEENLSTTYKEL